MRVVGGTAGGIPLHLPKGAGDSLRPTMDMVKNAIFNTLAESIAGIRVLDLFAGAGGLGIEALSRGAASCVFVEGDRRACDSIRRNLEKTRLTGGEVICADAMRWIERNAAAFDLILADPPYAKRPGERDFTAELLASPALPRAVTQGGLFIMEHLPGAKLPPGGAWDCIRQKKYGATGVAFFRRADGAASAK